MPITDYTSDLGDWSTGGQFGGLSQNILGLMNLIDTDDYSGWDPDTEGSEMTPWTFSPGIPQDAVDVQDYEGIQTIDWSNPLTGAQYGANQLMDMSPQQLASMLANFSMSGQENIGEVLGDQENPDLYFGGAMDTLTNELAQALQYSAWDAGNIGPQAQLNNQIQLAQEQEASIWDQYSIWESGQMELYNENIAQAEEAYAQAQTDIADQKRETLSRVRSSKRALESGAATQMQQLSSKLGKAGLGGGAALDAQRRQQSIISNQLKGLNLEGKQARETARLSLEGAAEGYSTGLEGLARGFAGQQLSQLQGVQQDIESLQSSFETEASNIYGDWMSDLLGTITNLTTSEFSPEGFEDIVFDPNEGMGDYFGDSTGG